MKVEGAVWAAIYYPWLPVLVIIAMDNCPNIETLTPQNNCVLWSIDHSEVTQQNL